MLQSATVLPLRCHPLTHLSAPAGQLAGCGARAGLCGAGVGGRSAAAPRRRRGGGRQPAACLTGPQRQRRRRALGVAPAGADKQHWRGREGQHRPWAHAHRAPAGAEPGRHCLRGSQPLSVCLAASPELSNLSSKADRCPTATVALRPLTLPATRAPTNPTVRGRCPSKLACVSALLTAHLSIALTFSCPLAPPVHHYCPMRCRVVRAAQRRQRQCSGGLIGLTLVL